MHHRSQCLLHIMLSRSTLDHRYAFLLFMAVLQFDVMHDVDFPTQGNYTLVLDDEWAVDAIGLVDRTHAFSAVHMNHSRYKCMA